MLKTPAPTRLLIHGASGRMGQAVLRLAAADAAVQVVAAITRSAPVQRVVDGIAYFAAAELAGAPAFDVAIDFSLPAGLEAVLALSIARGAGLVCGTTGLSAEQHAALAAAAARIPLVWASNFSLGVAVLGEITERAAALLPGWDCDIVESHHRHKRDAPSGTALTLGAAVELGGGAPRYASLRAGDIIGEHCVQFTGAGERLELVHRATSRDIFAHGALHAARCLAGRAPGHYRVHDLLSNQPLSPHPRATA